MTFAAVILAGGRSSRMGRDKAWLPLDGQPLVARQIAVVRELAPAEVLVSGRADTDYAALGCPVVRDAFADAGPLAGIAAGLEAAHAPLVLVLAVDMPSMTAAALRRLATGCTEGTGVVPRIDGRLEPLVAFYPKAAAPLALDLLRRQRRAAHWFADGCREAGLVDFREVPESDWPCFANWNSPDDLPGPDPGAG